MNPAKLREKRARVMRRYARLGPRGEPVVCDISRWSTKVIFDTQAAADECAAAMAHLPDVLSMEGYRCERAEHFHMRTVRSGSRGRGQDG